MNEYSNMPHELDWDDEIVDDGSGSFILLPEGDYDFTVTAFERGRYPGSKKIPPCGKAILTLSVNTPEGTASVKTDIICYSSLKWKITNFFVCLGLVTREQAKAGYTPPWNKVTGSTGRAHFKLRTYTGNDGTEKQTNDVEKFYDKNSASNSSPGGGGVSGGTAPAAPSGGYVPGKF